MPQPKYRVRVIDPPASPPPSRADLLRFLASLLGRRSAFDHLSEQREVIRRNP
jgi:hypothetical protein